MNTDGIRKIGEAVLKEGRSFIYVNEDHIEWEDIPVGALCTKDGDIKIKLEGESDWSTLVLSAIEVAALSRSCGDIRDLSSALTAEVGTFSSSVDFDYADALNCLYDKILHLATGGGSGSTVSTGSGITAEERARWDNKADSSTTLAGYHIGDVYTKGEVDSRIAAASIAGGGTGATVTEEEKESWNNKVNRGSTLADYTIGNAYTKTETDARITSAVSGVAGTSVTAAEKTSWNNKADKSTTLAGYTIGDAYTKSEVDNKFALLPSSYINKEMVNTFSEIATHYPFPENNWCVFVRDTGTRYCYVESLLRWVTIETTAPIAAATTTADGLLSAVDKAKLNGVAVGANNYTHPAAHPASIITTDATHRFMTDDQIAKLSGVEAGANHYTHPVSHPASVITEDATHRFLTDTQVSKLNGIEAEANKYTHPTTHPATIIATDATHRFVTDTQINKLDSIEANANRYTHPATHPASIIVQDDTHRFVTSEQLSAIGRIGSGGGSLTEDENHRTLQDYQVSQINSASANNYYYYEGRTVTTTDITGSSSGHTIVEIPIRNQPFLYEILVDAYIWVKGPDSFFSGSYVKVKDIFVSRIYSGSTPTNDFRIYGCLPSTGWPTNIYYRCTLITRPVKTHVLGIGDSIMEGAGASTLRQASSPALRNPRTYYADNNLLNDDGSSHTRMGLTSTSCMENNWFNRLQLRDTLFINRAVGGSTARQWVESVTAADGVVEGNYLNRKRHYLDMHAIKPEYALVNIGGNDLLGNPANLAPTQVFFDTIVSRLCDDGITPILCSYFTPDNRLHPEAVNMVRQYNQWVASYARSNGFNHIDFRNVTLNYPTDANAYLSPNYNGSGVGGSDFSDEVHPCDSGYEKLLAYAQGRLYQILHPHS